MAFARHDCLCRGFYRSTDRTGPIVDDVAPVFCLRFTLLACLSNIFCVHVASSLTESNTSMEI